MSSKVVEADAGIHSLAMAVAVCPSIVAIIIDARVLMFVLLPLIQPVTSWRLYGMTFPLSSLTLSSRIASTQLG